MDNAPVHLTNITLEYVRVEKLPKNTTAHLQPCDAGIIHSFKCQYKKIFLEDRLVAWDRMSNCKYMLNILITLYLISFLLFSKYYNCGKFYYPSCN